MRRRRNGHRECPDLIEHETGIDDRNFYVPGKHRFKRYLDRRGAEYRLAVFIRL
jgi:hypothetical protein